MKGGRGRNNNNNNNNSSNGNNRDNNNNNNNISFRTEIKGVGKWKGEKVKVGKITHQQQITAIGSCFVENISNYLTQRLFRLQTNPFGIVYNPLSIAYQLQLLSLPSTSIYQYTEKDIRWNNEVWHSFQHHSHFSNYDKSQLIDQLNKSYNSAYSHFQTTKRIFLTFGTNVVYIHKQSGEVVANCHKYPHSHFLSYSLSPQQIIDCYSPLFSRLLSINNRSQSLPPSPSPSPSPSSSHINITNHHHHHHDNLSSFSSYTSPPSILLSHPPVLSNYKYDDSAIVERVNHRNNNNNEEEGEIRNMKKINNNSKKKKDGNDNGGDNGGDDDDLQIILSVSPIRYLNEGMVENNISKATLLLVCSELCKIFKGRVFYFPSYEIMMDDLRDYRFYEADMIHPNQTAIEYISQIFGDTFFSSATRDVISQIEKINSMRSHRPMYSSSHPNYQAFLQSIDSEITSLYSRYPFLPPFVNKLF